MKLFLINSPLSDDVPSMGVRAIRGALAEKIVMESRTLKDERVTVIPQTNNGKSVFCVVTCEPELEAIIRKNFDEALIVFEQDILE